MPRHTLSMCGNSHVATVRPEGRRSNFNIAKSAQHSLARELLQIRRRFGPRTTLPTVDRKPLFLCQERQKSTTLWAEELSEFRLQTCCFRCYFLPHRDGQSWSQPKDLC